MQAHKNAGVFSIFTPFFENRLKGSGEKAKFFQVKKIPKYTQKNKIKNPIPYTLIIIIFKKQEF